MVNDERVYYTMKQAGIRNAGGWVAFIIGKRVSTSASEQGRSVTVCCWYAVRIIYVSFLTNPNNFLYLFTNSNHTI
jgi:hypothetical protein